MRKTVARKRKAAVKRRRIRVALLAGSLAAIIVIGMMLSATAIVAQAFTDLPTIDNPKLSRQPQKTKIYDANGAEVAQLYAENRENVVYSQISPWMIKAIVAAEDERFYQHQGVDIKGIMRALAVDVASGKVVEGGSTITQQFVKTTLGMPEKTLTRKLREAILAYRLEKKYPGRPGKDKILTMYLNTVYYGAGAYGIETASQRYFYKHAKTLTLPQAAFLAGMVQSPGAFSPYQDRKQAYARRSEVLKKMLRNRFITKEQYVEATGKPLKFAYPTKQEFKTSPYFLEYVKSLLIKKFGANMVFQGGLRVRTTLNPRRQRMAESAVRNALYDPDDPAASLTAIDPKNGYIEAMVGGKNFARSKFNLATQGRRQPGSAFKMFVLVAALEKGISPYDTYDSSTPITISLPGKDWHVSNAEPGTGGAMTLVDATTHSVNVVFAQLMMDVKPKTVVRIARQMGIRSPVESNPAVALGGMRTGVTTLDMSTAYATLASQGIYHAPVAITDVRQGRKILYKANTKGKRVIPKDVASEATRMLEGVIIEGTGRAADIGRPAAGKTGTSQTYRDAWFCGFTPDMACAVWVGYPKRQISMEDVRGVRVFGGTFPAEIWASFMSEALADTPETPFPFKSMGFKRKNTQDNTPKDSGKQGGGNQGGGNKGGGGGGGHTPQPSPQPNPTPEPPAPPPTPPSPSPSGTPWWVPIRH